MPILVCNHCNTYFEIHSKGELVELGNCECGNKLKYFESIEDYYNEEESISESDDELFEYLINSYESAVVRIILYGINELPFPLGSNKFINVLRGGKASVIIDYNLNELNSYSSLSHFSAKRLNRYIDTMERRGLIEKELVTKFKRPTLSITEKGFKYLSLDENLPFRIYRRKSKNLMKDVDKNLYDILRDLRKKIAKKEDIQAYLVCNNEVLLLMAKEMPTNYDSLLSIKGVGNKFMAKYGDLFLNTIIKYKY